METKRKYCGSYQQARLVKGRPQCPYPRRTCPYGLHACQACGLFGHGAEECRHIETTTEVEPPTEPSASASSAAPPTHIATEPKKEEDTQGATDKSVFVPGFGRKGEGKAANYGTPIPPPTVVDAADLPAAIRDVNTSGRVKQEEEAQDVVEIPTPIPATTEDVETWLLSGFKKLTDISTKMPPECGESVLWRGVKMGPNGQPSTKCEWFNGKVHFVQVEGDEIYLYIN